MVYRRKYGRKKRGTKAKRKFRGKGKRGTKSMRVRRARRKKGLNKVEKKQTVAIAKRVLGEVEEVVRIPTPVSPSGLNAHFVQLSSGLSKTYGMTAWDITPRFQKIYANQLDFAKGDYINIKGLQLRGVLQANDNEEMFRRFRNGQYIDIYVVRVLKDGAIDKQSYPDPDDHSSLYDPGKDDVCEALRDLKPWRPKLISSKDKTSEELMERNLIRRQVKVIAKKTCKLPVTYTRRVGPATSTPFEATILGGNNAGDHQIMDTHIGDAFAEDYYTDAKPFNMFVKMKHRTKIGELEIYPGSTPYVVPTKYKYWLVADWSDKFDVYHNPDLGFQGLGPYQDYLDSFSMDLQGFWFHQGD